MEVDVSFSSSLFRSYMLQTFVRVRAKYDYDILYPRCETSLLLLHLIPHPPVICQCSCALVPSYSLIIQSNCSHDDNLQMRIGTSHVLESTRIISACSSSARRVKSELMLSRKNLRIIFHHGEMRLQNILLL